MDNCIFCKIINGDIPCYKVYEDDYILAFLDINPDSNGHTLIIPKKHYKDLEDIDLDTITKIFEAAKSIAASLTEKLDCDGFTLIQNNGHIQEVKHFHLHIKPYYTKQKMVYHTDKKHIIDVKRIHEKLTNQKEK